MFPCEKPPMVVVRSGAAPLACPPPGTNLLTPCLPLTGLAAICNAQIFARTPGGKTALQILDGIVLTAAWHRGQLVVVERVAPAGRFRGELRAALVDFPETSDPTEASLVLGFEPEGADSARLVSGGEGGALWLIVGVKSPVASVLDGDTFRPRGEPLSHGTDVIGVDGSGALLMVDRKSASLDKLTVDGRSTRRALPFRPAKVGPMSGDLPGERVLLFDEQGGLHQSDDGGVSFHAVEPPPHGVKSDEVVCSSTRCLLGDGLIREGWGARSTGPVAAPESDVGTSFKDEPPPRPERWLGTPIGEGELFPALNTDDLRAFAQGARPVTYAELGCHKDPSLDPLPASSRLTIRFLSAGPPGATFAAIGTNARGQFVEVLGRGGGKTTVRLLGPKPGPMVRATIPWLPQAPPRPAPVHIIEPGGKSFPHVFLGVDVGVDSYRPIGKGFLMVWDTDPDRPLRVASVDAKDDLRFRGTAWFEGPGAMARIVPGQDEVEVYSTGGARRSVSAPPGLLTGLPFSVATGYLAAPDERRVVLLMQEHTKEPSAFGEDVLVYLDGKGGGRRQGFVANPVGSGDAGAGLWVNGGEATLVMLEATDDGGSELRLRRLDEHLSSDAARAVQGARFPPGERLSLPACAPGQLPDGEVEIVQGPRPGVGRAQSDLVRSVLVRFDERGACARSESVRFGELDRFTVGVFRPGGREGVVFDRGRLLGVRCDP
jgi:hypothetical protein